MYTDVPEGFEIICKRCGASFDTYYYSFGSINHSNNTSEHNLKALIARGDFEKEVAKYKDVDKKCALLWKEKQK